MTCELCNGTKRMTIIERGVFVEIDCIDCVVPPKEDPSSFQNSAERGISKVESFLDAFGLLQDKDDPRDDS